jgi:hypothetical protein
MAGVAGRLCEKEDQTMKRSLGDNLTCRAAAREQRRYQWTGVNRFTTPGGYRCRPSGRGAIGYQIRCLKGSRAYRIEFAD